MHKPENWKIELKKRSPNKLLLLISIPILNSSLLACSTSTRAPIDADVEQAMIVSNENTIATRRYPFFTDNSTLHHIAARSVKVSDARSVTRELVLQKMTERKIIVKERWPKITPVAQIDSLGNEGIGAGASFTLYDFGRTKAALAIADNAIEQAKLDLWGERISVISEVVLEVIRASEEKAQRNAVKKSLSEVSQLSDLARTRLNAGYKDQSESVLFDLRVAELKDRELQHASALKIAISRIRELTDEDVSEDVIPELAVIRKQILDQAIGQGSYKFRSAMIDLLTAKQIVKQVASKRYPDLLLGGGVNYKNGKLKPNLTLSLDSSKFSAFSGGLALAAAHSALSSAESRKARVQQEDMAELKNYYFESERLKGRKRSLEELQRQGLTAIELFLHQQEFGERGLTDGISVHRSYLNSVQELNKTRADILRNAVRAAVVNGTLLEFQHADEH